MADRDSRRAARWASVVAVPVALLAGAIAFLALAARDGDEPAPGPTTPAPQSSAPVEMAAPPLNERASLACRALLSHLPDRIRDLPRRPVTAGPEQNAAYGDPAVTVACGGPAPSVAPTDFLLRMDSVCWHSAVASDGSTAWTTADREVPVRVRVPSGYEQPAQWANEFSGAVASAIAPAAAPPSGCR